MSRAMATAQRGVDDRRGRRWRPRSAEQGPLRGCDRCAGCRRPDCGRWRPLRWPIPLRGSLGRRSGAPPTQWGCDPEAGWDAHSAVVGIASAARPPSGPLGQRSGAPAPPGMRPLRGMQAPRLRSLASPPLRDAGARSSACHEAVGATAKADARPPWASTAPDSPRSLPPASSVEPIPCSRAHPASRVPRPTLRGAPRAKRGDATVANAARRRQNGVSDFHAFSEAEG